MKARMSSLIVDRDREIIKHIEKYGFITLDQTQKCFMPNNNCSYKIASRRLKEIYKAGFINVFRDRATNCNVYVYKHYKGKIPSMHKIKLLDVYAELKRQGGCNILEFETEKFWNDGKIRSDGFVVFSIKNVRYYYFIEIQIANVYHNLEKYDVLYQTGEVQAYLKDKYNTKDNYFPRILFISDTNYGHIYLTSTKVVQLDLNFSNFATIFI